MSEASGNRLSRWLRKSIRRAKPSKKSKCGSNQGCHSALAPCISCRAVDEMPSTLPPRPGPRPEPQNGSRRQVLLPSAYHHAPHTNHLNNNHMQDVKYQPSQNVHQPTIGNTNEPQRASGESNALSESKSRRRHKSDSNHPPRTTATLQQSHVHNSNPKGTTHGQDSLAKHQPVTCRDSENRDVISSSMATDTYYNTHTASVTSSSASKTQARRQPSNSSRKRSSSTSRISNKTNSPRTLSPRNIALDFPKADTQSVPPHTPSGLANTNLSDNPGSSVDNPPQCLSVPYKTSDKAPCDINRTSMTAANSVEHKLQGTTIPGSHINSGTAQCIIADDEPRSGYQSDSNLIVTKGSTHGGSHGFHRDDVTSGYMSACEHPTIASKPAQSVASHASSATLRSECVQRQSLLNGISQRAHPSAIPASGSGSDGRRTPLQMAMAANSRCNIPTRATSPHAVISKDQVFSIYKTYKEEVKRTGTEPQPFIIQTQPHPALDVSQYSNDTESELESIMSKLKNETLSPDDTYESRARPRRRNRRSKSQDALRSKGSGQLDSQVVSRGMPKSLSGHLSDQSRGSRSRSEPVKPRSLSPQVIQQTVPTNFARREAQRTSLKKSKSYHSISPLSKQSRDSTSPVEQDHMFRTRSIPSIQDPDPKGPGTIMDTSSESSLSCLSSSEEEDDDDDDIKKPAASTPTQHRSRSHTLLQEDEKEGRQFVMRRWWSTLGGIVPPGDVSEAIPEEEASHWSDTVSLATTASYFPGVSAADKLRLAASKGQIDKVKELVAAGVSVEPDREGRTALHYAALNGHPAIVQLIGAETNDIDLQDNLGYTALHRAAAQGHLEVIKVLISEGCLLDKQDEVHGNSALHEAAWNGYSRTLELLVKSKARVNIVNKAGFTPLHLAAQNGHNQSARVLLYANCNPDQKNNYGDTALHTASRYGHAGVTRILISARCNTAESNKNGDTALHITAALKRRKIAKLLIDSNIDVNIRNKQNETAIDVARRKDHPEIIMIIAAQPKVSAVKPKKKKNKKEGEPEEGEKKEKKGFFFRKKKSKAQEAKEAAAKASAAPSVVAPSIAPSIAAPSEISSALYHDRGGPEHAYQHYQHPAQTQLPHDLVSLRDRRTSQRGAGTGPGSVASSKVKGLLSQYTSKDGVQYFRDLAGNVKQGPVGFAPACHCGPQFKRVEQQAAADRANLYDHVDAVQRTINSRLDALDRRTAQQNAALERMSRERMSLVRREREEAMGAYARQERMYTEHHVDQTAEAVKTELKSWVDARIHTLRSKLESHDDSCDFTHKRSRRRHRDMAPAAGRLYRSKSDETLSVTSTPGRQSSKSRARMIKELKHLNSTRKHLKDGEGLVVHEHPAGHSETRTFHDDSSELHGCPDGHSFSDQLSVSNFHASQLEGKTSSPADPPNRARDLINIMEEDSMHNDSNSSIVFSHHDNSLEPADSGCSTNQCPSPLYQYEYMTEPVKAGTNKSDSGYSKSHKGSKVEGDTSNASSNDSGNAKSNTSSEPPMQVTRQFFDNVSVQMEKWYERRLNEVERKAEDRVKQESQAMRQRIQSLEERMVGDNIKMSSQIEGQIGTQV